MPLAPAPVDFLLYLLTAILLMFTGVGVFRLMRATIDASIIWLLAPAVTAAFWAAVLGLGTAERIAIRLLAGPIWVATLALAFYGYRWKRARDSATSSLVALNVGLPVLVMLPYFVFGLASYPGSRLPDGWSYVAYGQYLWKYPRGAEGGLQPLYQYASHLSETRHVASGELGLLSVLTDVGSTQSSTGLFLALMLYGFSSSCAAFARARGWPLKRSLLVVTVATLSGWMMNTVLANNYDNLAALSAFPALATLITVLRERALGTWASIGLVSAGLFYTYPELAAVVGPLVALMMTERLWKTPALRSRWGVLVAAGVFTILVSPYAVTAIQFFISQARFGLQSGSRPGEGYFPGLLVPAHQPSAFWALGGENQIAVLHGWQTMAAVGLFFLLARGLTRLVVTRDVALLCVLVLPLVGAPYFIAGAAYSYGAYKMIIMGWWALAFAVVVGASDWPGPSAAKTLASALALAFCLAIPLVATARAIREVANAPDSGIERFRSVRDVATLAAGSPIGVFVDDWEASQWAVYFLRESPIRLGDFDAYLAMPHVRSRLARASIYPWTNVRLVLTDAVQQGPVREEQGWTLMWQNAAYRLWDAGPNNWAIVTEVRVPNGLERIAENRFFWLGGGPATFRIIARDAGCVRVSAAMTPGPREKRTDSRTVTIESTAGQREVLALVPGQNRFALWVQPDVNDIVLTPSDEPDLPPQGPDKRPLVARLANLSTQVERASAQIQAIENPNGLEQVDGKPFFWLGAGPATVRVISSTAGNVLLVADLGVGPSLSSEVQTRRLRVRIPSTGYQHDAVVTNGPWTLPINVGLGETFVQLEALDRPTVGQQANGDRRPLVLAVRNLRIRSTDPSANCR